MNKFLLFVKYYNAREGDFLMKKTRITVKNHYRVITLMVLTGFFISCGLVQAQVRSEQVANQIRPEIRSQLQTLQQEIGEKGYTFTVGYSPAMEYTIPQLCGLVEPPDWQRFAPFEKMESYMTALPQSYDVRTDLTDGNTTVRNQGSCGSCWAFGTVGPLEILISHHCRVRVDLSEQYLVSCNESGWGCSGGWFAHEYHQWHVPTSKKETDAGAVLEGLFPYKASDVACNGPHNSHPYKIDGWSYISGYSVPSVAAIKQAIQTYGPVAAAVCVGSGFQSYRGGVFNANETCSGNVNHAITLVGWNDDNGPDNGYWILKNSWGPLWGEAGYMRIRYGVSKVGYAANYIEFSDCGGSAAPDLNCANATPLSLGVLTPGLTTVGGHSDVSSYSLGGRAESGPEKVFQVTTTKTGDLTAALGNLTTDLDVFILNACDPNNAVAFGETSAKYVNAPPGTYYVVVDGNNGASGSFSLQTTLVTRLPDLTGSWTQITPYYGGKTIYGALSVSNAGNANAGRFTMAYYLSNDGRQKGSYLGSQTATAGLNAGQTLSLNPVFSSRASLAGKYIMAVIDYDAKIAESNENNNVAVGGKILRVAPR
jgi:C1A family cysteine protease